MRRLLLCQGAFDWKQQWIEKMLSFSNLIRPLAFFCATLHCDTSCFKVAGRSWNCPGWQKAEPLTYPSLCLCGHTRVWVSEWVSSRPPRSPHPLNSSTISFIPFLFPSFFLFICKYWQILLEGRFPSLFACCARAFIYLQGVPRHVFNSYLGGTEWFSALDPSGLLPPGIYPAIPSETPQFSY